MYLGAQRVIDDGGQRSVTAYLYLHGEGLSAAQRDMLRDVRWVSQLAPGQLAREQHEGTAGGRRVVSYIEITGPDETDGAALRRVLDALAQHVVAGRKQPIEHEKWGAEFFRGGEISEDPQHEFADLRARLEAFFADGETAPPSRELTVWVSREGDTTRFAWDGASLERLVQDVVSSDRANIRLSISDDTREAFQNQYGDLFPHVLGLLAPDGGLDVEQRGGVAFKDKVTGKVLWVSPVERSPS